MRTLMVDKLTSCEMVVFNRTDSSTDRMPLHKLVRGVSRKANICYEDTDGEIDFDNIENNDEITESMLPVDCSEAESMIKEIKDIYNNMKLMRIIKQKEEENNINTFIK